MVANWDECFLRADVPPKGTFRLVFVLIRSDGQSWNAGGDLSADELAHADSSHAWESRHQCAIRNLQAANDAEPM